MEGNKQPIKIGWAAEDITPGGPVELKGQYYQRISQGVRDPLMATALALEAGDGNGDREQALLVTLDATSIKRKLQNDIRERIESEIPDLDPSSLFLNAIHTHTSPVLARSRDWWSIDEEVLDPEEYRELVIERTARAVIRAWQNRKPGYVGRALGRASVGHCRRAVYADGTAEMYGRTDRNDFVGMEGNEDSGVDMLFFWDENQELTGVIINLACPSQVMEATYRVSADYAGEVRRRLKERFFEDTFVLTQISAAGDQSPRDLIRGCRSEPDLWSEEGLLAIGSRLADVVEEALPRARETMQNRVEFEHTVKEIELPTRKVTEPEFRRARQNLEELLGGTFSSVEEAFSDFVSEVRANEAKGSPRPYDSKLHDFVMIKNNEAVIDRYKGKDVGSTVPLELHVLRLGEVVLVTNPFELFLEYGHRMKARSPAEQTFIIQLACDALGYLPTERAAAAGGYGGLILNGKVGPQGGDQLVEETVEAIDALWGEW